MDVSWNDAVATVSSSRIEPRNDVSNPAGWLCSIFSHVSVAASATENLPKREGALLESENNETFLLRAGDLQERPINPAPLPPGPKRRP
jgi:hypothetical protein